MYSVHQHWDPLKVCVVGRSWPPEFYSWIQVPHVRSLFEKIAIETEEDYQAIISKLQQFGVEVLRPTLPELHIQYGRYVIPPMSPRDGLIMIGNTLHHNGNREDPSNYLNCYKHILDHVEQQGNQIKQSPQWVNGAMCTRVGRDLYFGTYKDEPFDQIQQHVVQEFDQYRTHVIKTDGHTDGTFCPVAPGLIISLRDIPTYKETFPDWEVVYLPGQSWGQVGGWLDLKFRNSGKWWIPGFEQDQDVIDTVEQWLGHWTGYVEETVFDVNMLVIDPHNVIVFNYNKQVFDALERYNITPHIVTFRHRYFWDGGIHCVTTDLHREGVLKDYFTERG